MELSGITCPNCGAGLGQPQGDVYVCAYCGHRSAPPRPALDQAAQDEQVAKAIAEHDAKRMELARAAAEGASRARLDEQEADTRNDGSTVRAVGALFLVMGVGFLGYGCLCPLFTIVDPYTNQACAFFRVFSVFWFLLGGGMFRAGRRTLQALQLEDRLRASGLHGLATIVSCGPVKYLWGLLIIDYKLEMVLRIEILGRSPWTVKITETTAGRRTLLPGQQLPVFVDPDGPRKVVVDWTTADAM